ncbi:MAG: hypothetical protein KC646_18240 [Candidatus Cloacimonetes bacterium]|nr:hypothetical protein [Candidatus Cloacimonadota bacterium]
MDNFVYNFTKKLVNFLLLVNVFSMGVQNCDCQATYNPSYEESPEFQGIDSVKQIDHLFYDNEARDLLAHYKRQDSSAMFIEQIQGISKKLSLEINSKNRSKRLLHVMRVLNFFHDEKKEVRFAIIEHLTLKQLYDLVFLWRQAIYTSSFNGVFDKIKSRVENSEDATLMFSTLKSNDFEGFNAFIQTCSAYNRLGECFAFFSIDQQISLMKSYAIKMNSTKNYYYAMAWVEVMLQTSNRKLLSFMEDFLLKKINQSNFEQIAYEHDFEKMHYVDREQFYESLSPHRELSNIEFYGLIMGSYFSFDSIRTLQLSDKFIAKGVQWAESNKEYIPNNYQSVELIDLSTEQGDSTQRHFYYGDSDGWATWVAFLRKHKRIATDKVIENNNYVKIIRSDESLNTNLVIYANKPGKRISGQKSIDNEMLDENTQSHIFVHRGHSYHLHRGLDKIEKNTKLAILGSCGGYNDLHSVMKRSLDVQVVISKGKGTYWVNRAILDVINEDISLGNDIDWSKFRERVSKILKNQHHIKNRFQDMIDIFNEYYVLPNENVGLAMLNKAIHLLNDGQVDAIASVKQ